MKPRILTALILLPPVVCVLGWSPWWLFLVALIAVVEVALREYFHICRHSGFTTFPVAGYLGAAAICLAQAAALKFPEIPLTLVTLALFGLLTMTFAPLWTENLKQYLAGAATTILGVLYVGWSLAVLIPLRFSDEAKGRYLILLLFLVIWAGDICAYFVGRTMGRHLLFPRVSPKKTVEGAIGGLAGSLLVAWGLTHWFWHTADWRKVMLLAGLINVAGQVGDFVESAMKRGAELKDSGTILPGHGGMLDRIDALLFGSVALWLVLALDNQWPL